jgi:GT2 family glycosyltransferase
MKKKLEIMETQPLVSIITINYKQSAVTNQLLTSLAYLTWKNVEVVVVDNNSGDDCWHIKPSLAGATLVTSSKNLGFAGGNNLGISKAKGDYILLLNNDTVVEPGLLEPLVAWFEQHPDAGAVSPKIRYFHQPDTIQYAGFTTLNPFTLRMHGIGCGHKDLNQHDQPRRTHFAHGCAMMVSRAALETVGPMNEEYFLYYEEHDWSARIKKAGFNIYYVPGPVVYHKESVSVKKNSTLQTYFLNRNRILFMRRNLGPFYRICASLYLALVSFPWQVVTLLAKKDTTHLHAYLDAITWNITNKTKNSWNL